MTFNKRAASILSLASRAGKIASGGDGAEKSLQSGASQLIIISSEASANTKKKFVNKCHYYGIEAVICGTTEGISKAVGRQARMVVSVEDAGFAKLLKECMPGTEDGNGIYEPDVF
ncbi:MAG: ribosomal L7Ae/L30e/S12e/Gadd45 family protein [Defluviitaleaceae bacterium]|nr:ribosomal L7Ae/L30e/S12e/Gadd45 family protein [Defluviitaleaceae bacterium]